MAYLPRSTPDRMIVLSILPPPGPGQPRVPFGFGALIVEQAHRGEAHFELHARRVAGEGPPCRAAPSRAGFANAKRSLKSAPLQRLLFGDSDFMEFTGADRISWPECG